MEFKVDPGDLESLAHGLSGLLGDLERAGDVRSLSPGAAENAQLEGAIAEFLSRWTQNVESLQQALKTLTERLERAGEGYGQQEQGVLGGFAV
jgi:hypothetical protein